MPAPFDPVASADDPARLQAHALMTQARHAALAWTDPATGTPGISRIAFALDPAMGPLTLISGLAPHFAALQAAADCAVLIGEPAAAGDPLTHPRLMLRARAAFVPATDPVLGDLRTRWLARAPKAKAYIDLPDFAFVRLVPQSGLLNGGFARAFRLTAEDLSG